MEQNNKPYEPYGYVALKDLKQMIEQIEPDIGAEGKITFEYFMMRFFPKMMDNIEKEMQRQHTLGFIEGLSQNENGNQGNN